MRPIVQFTLAAAVVAGATAAAFAITNSACDPGSATRALLTHSWTIQGEGAGKCQYTIDDGFVFFGSESLGLSLSVNRKKPAGPDGAAYVSTSLPRKSATQTVYRVNVNSGSRGLTSEEQLELLAQQGFLITPVVNAESDTETRSYHPIAGNVTTTWAATNVNARVYRNFSEYNLDSVTKYKGMVSGGPNDGRNIRGILRIQLRGADRTNLAAK